MSWTEIEVGRVRLPNRQVITWRLGYIIYKEWIIPQSEIFKQLKIKWKKIAAKLELFVKGSLEEINNISPAKQ